MKRIPLVVHLIYKLDVGGLETLLVECINRMPADKYRHAVVCLTDYTEFAKKISNPDVQIIALNKAPGLGLATHVEIWKLFRRLRPSVLHTYNLSAIEYTLAATIAGVPVRVHAEHGRDASDPEGKNWKHNLLRRLLIPLVDMFVPVSADLQNWLKTVIHVPDCKNRLINNGVDTHQFKQAQAQSHEQILPAAHFPADCFVIGAVGRIQDVKNHAGLIDAFIQLRELMPLHQSRLRLAIIGDGPLLPKIREQVAKAGLNQVVWLPGARQDVAELMQTFSVFAMSSIAEGTPVVILEAMASGLPVIATKVGGIPEVVIDNLTGKLVDNFDALKFARALSAYVAEPQLIREHGTAGRQRVEDSYSIDAMLHGYTGLYDSLCASKTTI
jgi:sugar transferase (PEP-CTERM/EpsH1 system associated)